MGGEEQNNLLGGENNNNNNNMPPQNYPPQQQQGYDHNQSPYPNQPYPPTYQNQPPQYMPPQYMPPQQQPYGQPPNQPYQQYPQGEAVVVGVAPTYGGEHHHHNDYFPLIEESFGDQMRKLPRRMIVAITKGKVSEYNELKRGASWPMVFFLLFIEVVWAICLASIVGAITNRILSDSNNYYNSDEYVNMGPIIGYTILSSLVWYFSMNGLFHMVALCVGGGKSQETSSNKFLQLCFLSLLFSVPLGFISILTVIPNFIGSILAFIILVWRFLLIVITLQSVYGVSSGQAVGIIVVYVCIVIVFLLVMIFALGATLANSLAYAM